MTNNIESTAHRTPWQPLFAIPAVIHWHGLTDTQPLKRTTEIIKYFFCVGLIFICIFVVRINSLCHGANSTKNAETKIRGRHTGASPAVISLLRNELVRSDLPSLFNFKSFFMRTKNDECATCAQKPVTAEQIVSDILIWDDPENIREDLHEMMLAFFMHYESPTEEFKGRIYCTYTTLYNALKAMEQLNPRRKEVCHVNA